MPKEAGPFKVQVLDYLADSDEYPHPVQDVPLWSENDLTQFYDPEAQVGVYMHLSRAAVNPNVWLENFVVYLPGDQFLVSRGYGNREGRRAGRRPHERTHDRSPDDAESRGAVRRGGERIRGLLDEAPDTITAG